MWLEVQKYSEEDFKRHTGVTRAVFAQMVTILEAKAATKKKRGRPLSFCIEDQLLIAFEYWREYRTYFHIAHSWKTQESTVCRIVRRVEDTLIADKTFHLPGKKALLEKNAFEIVVVDATETPIERPKKNKNAVIAARKSSIR
jgi:Helix-turn-helix of DDE superfamily endonuclease